MSSSDYPVRVDGVMVYPKGWPINFNVEEFAISGCVYQRIPKRLVENVRYIAWNLQVLRDRLQGHGSGRGIVIIVLSGYRSPGHNAKVGGAKKSQHMLGRAADIHALCLPAKRTQQVVPISPRVVAAVVEGLQSKGKMELGGLHAYRGFTHVDIRRHRARW